MEYEIVTIFVRQILSYTYEFNVKNNILLIEKKYEIIVPFQGHHEMSPPQKGGADLVPSLLQ